MQNLKIHLKTVDISLYTVNICCLNLKYVSQYIRVMNITYAI